MEISLQLHDTTFNYELPGILTKEAVDDTK